jgi:hypothetical protein
MSKWPFNAESNSRLRDKWLATFTDTYLGQRAYSACEFLIEKARDLCQEAQARLVVVTVPTTRQLDPAEWKRSFSSLGGPDKFDPDLPDRKIAGICERLKVPFIPTKDYVAVSDHFAGDGHWNESGHERVARLLESLHQEHVRRDGAQSLDRFSLTFATGAGQGKTALA